MRYFKGIVILICLILLASCRQRELFEMNESLLEEIESCSYPVIYEQDKDKWIIICDSYAYMYNKRKNDYISVPISDDDYLTSFAQDGYLYVHSEHDVFKYDFSGERVASFHVGEEFRVFPIDKRILVTTQESYSAYGTIYVLDDNLQVLQQVDEFDLFRDYFMEDRQFAGIADGSVYYLGDSKFDMIHTMEPGNELDIDFIGDHVFIIEDSKLGYQTLATKIFIYDGTELEMIYFDLSFDYGFPCIYGEQYFCYQESYGEYEGDDYLVSHIVLDQDGNEVARIDSEHYQSKIEFLTGNVYYIFDYETKTYTLYEVNGDEIDQFYIEDPDTHYYDFIYLNGTIVLEDYDYEVYQSTWYRIDGDQWFEIVEDLDWYGVGGVRYTLKETGEMEQIDEYGVVSTYSEDEELNNIEVTEDQYYFMFEDRILIVEDNHVMEYELDGTMIEEYDILASFKPIDYGEYLVYGLVQYKSGEVKVKTIR